MPQPTIVRYLAPSQSAGMTEKATLRARLRDTKVVDSLRRMVVGRIERDFLGRAATTPRGGRWRK